MSNKYKKSTISFRITDTVVTATPDTLSSSETIKELQTEYTNMLTAIIDLLDGAKYLWEGYCYEQ